jgi:Ca2+-binding EF-hand superfamily protein
MTISGIGTSNYYTGQMSTMWSRSGSAGMSGKMTQSGPMEAPPNPSEIFDKVDIDNSGGLDETEFQTLADKISEATGEEVDVAELFATHDADQDGVLSEEESMAALEANRPDGPAPGGMMAHGQREMSTAAGIAKYMQMASLGMEQDQYANMFAMSGGNSASFGSDGLFA